MITGALRCFPLPYMADLSHPREINLHEENKSLSNCNLRCLICGTCTSDNGLRRRAQKSIGHCLRDEGISGLMPLMTLSACHIDVISCHTLLRFNWGLH